jgi:hypothetical protein
MRSMPQAAEISATYTGTVGAAHHTAAGQNRSFITAFRAIVSCLTQNSFLSMDAPAVWQQKLISTTFRMLPRSSVATQSATERPHNAGLTVHKMPARGLQMRVVGDEYGWCDVLIHIKKHEFAH